MFLGLRTVVYHTDDLNGAKAWYSSVLGISPYFDQPFYVGFNVGGFELCVPHRLLTRLDRGFDKIAYQIFKLSPRKNCIDVLGASRVGRYEGQIYRRFFNAGQLAFRTFSCLF